MSKREKFGKFVLLEEIDTSALGTEFRAAKLGPSGFEKIVTVLRISPALSTNAEAAKSLMEQVKVAAQLQNPNILKIFGIGKVESSYYISFEFIEGRSLKAIFGRCRQEGFPFSVDHGLLIASKVCSALEYAHARRLDGGVRYFHGLLNPTSVLVSYEGEVRVRGFGYWPSRARETGAVGEEDSRYLAPEQTPEHAKGASGDPRSDIFAVGAILFETLVGRPLRETGTTESVASRLAAARLQSPAADDDSVPKPISDILSRSLAEDPGARYAEIPEMRKAIDTLLFSGDFTPTTFNLAFFMHSLFREDIETDSRRLKEERESNYLEYTEESARPAATAAPVVPAPAVATRAEPADQGSARPREEAPARPVPPRESPPHAHVRESSPATVPAVPLPQAAAAARETVAAAREAAAGFTFHKEEPARRSAVVPALLLLLLAAAGGAGYWFVWGPGKGQPPPVVQSPPALSPEVVAAMARVKELEEKLAAIEAEKAAAEAKAAEEAKKKVEAQAAARGQTADPAAVQKAQEDARRKAQVEQEKKQQEEKKRLEDEKRAEESRLAEERRKKDEEAARLAAATPEPTAPPTTTVPPAPAVRPGSLVNLSDPGVIPPVPERTPPVQYPPLAFRQRVEGTVELNVLVDEKGGVQDAQVITSAAGKVGLNEAAVETVKRRRYRPATKEGVPVKVWIPVTVAFKLPK